MDYTATLKSVMQAAVENGDFWLAQRVHRLLAPIEARLTTEKAKRSRAEARKIARRKVIVQP